MIYLETHARRVGGFIMRFDSIFSTAAYKHMHVTVVVNYRNYQSALVLVFFF